MKRRILTSVLLVLGMFMILNIPIASASLSDGLVAYYPFDGNADDASGHGNNGTEYGGLSYKMGVSGESASFDGIDDYIRVPSHSSLNPVDQFSISFWVKVDGFTNVWSPIVHKGGPSLSDYKNREYTVWLENTSSFLLASAGDNSAQYYNNACCARLGNWTHYVGIIDRQNHRMKIYVDGILKVDANDSYSTFNNNNNDLILGWTEEIDSSFSPFKGRVDDLRIYNRALTEDDVRALYDEHLPAIGTPTLIGHWAFEEGSGDTAFDSSTNDLDGNIVDVSYTAGIIGDYALDFNGSNSYVEVPYSALLNPDSIAISLWFKPRYQVTYADLIDKGHGWGTEPYYGGFVLQYDSDYSVAAIYGNGFDFYAVNSGPGLNDDKWHHLVANLGQSGLAIFIDNVLIEQEAGQGPIVDNDSPLYFGCHRVLGRHFYGLIDDIRIYDGPLSHNDVAELYLKRQIIDVAYADLFGETIQIPANHEFILEQNTQEEFPIQLINPSDDPQTATLEVMNPHSDLTVSVTQQNPITLASKEVLDIPIVINVGLMPIGVYDDVLLKLTVENGETLYSNVKITIVEQGTGNLPDLSISSQNIRLTDYTLGESVTLEAAVHNKGLSPVSNVQVKFYKFGNLLGETVLNEVPAEGIGTASITAPITTSGEHLIRVVVDFSNAIEELDETNNEGSQIIKLGDAVPIPGNILVTGSLPSTVYTDHLFTISGRAVYDIYVDGVRYTNYVVKGGSVQITLKGDGGTEWIYGGVHTNVDGYFSKTVQAPADPGNYKIIMTVTDNTFIGKRELVLSVTEPPPPSMPPPSPPTSSGIGTWTYLPSSGTWNWTWTTPPVNEPTPESDLRVFSENIHFSTSNPALDEEITVFTEILYWATSTDLVARDVPVNFMSLIPVLQR